MQGPQVRSEHWGRGLERLGIQEEALGRPLSQSLRQQEPQDLSGDRVGVVELGFLSSRANSGYQVLLSSSRTVSPLQGQPLPAFTVSSACQSCLLGTLVGRESTGLAHQVVSCALAE